jgi:DNA-binding response OmpR family regulator
MSSLLIIDDDTRTAEALALLLRREGHEAATVADAGKALEHLRRHDPDLVLLDLGMPRVDGMDLLDALKDEPRFSGLRIAVLTGRDDPQTAEAARRLGACDFIEKGVDWDTLYGRILTNLADASAESPADAPPATPAA